MSLIGKLSLVAAIALGLTATAEAQTAKVDEHELKKLQGTWVLVGGEMDGKPIPPESLPKSKITISGTAIVTETPHQSNQSIKATLQRMDATKSPPEMDWIRSSGPGAGKAMHAIYAFTGADSYRICFDPSGQVTGVVFGAALDDPETGFVLTVGQVEAAAQAAPGRTAAVATGPCAE